MLYILITSRFIVSQKNLKINSGLYTENAAPVERIVLHFRLF